MTDEWLLVLDEGTTSTRALLYAPDGKIGGMAQQSLTQSYPRPGWVEQDPQEILANTLACAREMIRLAGGPNRIAAIGITNQRETTLAWDKRSGRSVHRAIVWQDRRTSGHCDRLRAEGHEPAIQLQTGLLLDPYFSASKMSWLLDNVPEVRALGDNLAFGTVESWLVWHLTGGLHVTDATNASRTSLLPLGSPTWDEGLCDLFDVPRHALPDVVDCIGKFGTTSTEVLGGPIPITSLVGDQQAATIGQACLNPGDTKITLGTGAFVLSNTGHTICHSGNRLLTTILLSTDGCRTYALEGSIFSAGSAIDWLCNTFGLLVTAADSEVLARSVPDNGGVVFVPALSGLGAPHWRSDAKASLSGMTFATTKAHIVRAALEAATYQCHDLKDAFAADGSDWSALCIDGGMSNNSWLAQDLADILDIPCSRPADVETTARGAAMLAAVGAEIYRTLADAKAMLSPTVSFIPEIKPACRAERLRAWRSALTLNLETTGEV